MQKIRFRIVDMKASLPFSELALTVEPLEKIYLSVDLNEDEIKTFDHENYVITQEGIKGVFRCLHNTLTLERSDF